METIESLLGIQLDIIRDFPLLARGVVDVKTQRVVESNIRQLRNIEDKLYTNASFNPSIQAIDDVFKKVFRNYNTKKEELYSRRELKIVANYLSKCQRDPSMFVFCLDLLKQNWHDSFLRGIVSYVLDAWSMIPQLCREKVCKFIRERLSVYNGNNKRYLTLKNHADYFEENGPHRMASLLATKGVDILTAPTILGYKEATISYLFYSDVIINYFKGADNVDGVQQVLGIHNHLRTKKMLMANLVIEAERKGAPFYQERVSKLAETYLGDITLASSWAPFDGATIQDVQKLRRAKELVNLWYTRRVIDMFFEVCVQDPARKKFWLKYVDNIKDFRVVGSTYVKRQLQSDRRTCSIFSKIFLATNNEREVTAALALFVKNKVLVEFSDTGAFYSYNPDKEEVRFLTKRGARINKIGDLKDTSLPMLIETYGNSYYFTDDGQGRLSHLGRWQDRLGSWMKNYLLKQRDVASLFSGSNDDEVFKAKPLEEKNVDFITKANNKDNSVKPTLNNKDNQNIGLNNSNESKKQRSKAVTIRVSEIMSSKPIFNERYRIVSDSSAFYIMSICSGKSVKLKSFQFNGRKNGRIIINEVHLDRPFEIIYTYNRERFCIGFISLRYGDFFFKQGPMLDEIYIANVNDF